MKTKRSRLEVLTRRVEKNELIKKCIIAGVHRAQNLEYGDHDTAVCIEVELELHGLQIVRTKS